VNLVNVHVLYRLTNAETALAVSIHDILGYDSEVTITNNDNPADNDQVIVLWLDIRECWRP